MSQQPVKISDNLLLDARLMAQISERSISGQIEYWAKLGRVVESLLDGERVYALCRAGAVKPLSECLLSVDSAEGRKRVADYFKRRPYPHYENVSHTPGLIIRIEENGERSLGRFVNRKFQVVKLPKKTTDRSSPKVG